MELPDRILDAVADYEPVETDGLTLYPILVREYRDFMLARVSLESMQQSFPIRYVSMPILQAFYQMDYDALTLGKQPTGGFFSAVTALLLALRVGSGENAQERMKMVNVYSDKAHPERLKCLQIERKGQGDIITITPRKYRRLRAIIAAQNGVELVSEQANPDLVEAERTIAEINTPKLQIDFRTERNYVAVMEGRDEAALNDWPILKLHVHAQLLRRNADYQICAISEGAGAQYRNGNPVPHPYYPRKRGMSALQDFASYGGGIGARALQNAGKAIT